MSLTEALLSQGPSTGTVFGALLVCLVIYLFTISSSSQDKEHKYPPGPKPLPLLGNLHTLDLKKTYLSLCELAKQYGSIYTVYFGPRKVVILSGYKIIKQALVNLSEEFGDRDITPIFHDFNQGYGIAFSNGENWKEMRRFSLANLRDFGMGKKRSEEIITAEAQHLKEEFEKSDGKPFETTLPIALAVSNIICAIVYSTRFEYSNTKLHHMVKRAYENMKMTGSASVQLYNMFPWIRPFVPNQKRIVSNLKETLRQNEEIINGLRKTLNPQDPRGIADCFLIRQQKDEESGKTDSFYNANNLRCTMNNLFGAGTDTTATTLRWGLLLMVKYPEIQVKVQDEIDRVIGGRQPMAEDRKNLPFTDAVIHEIQRFADVAPLGAPRQTTCDVHLNGYLIKKGTSVWPLLVSALRDENEWETPDSFNPGHFLNKQGQFVKKDAFIPFSAGRRACPGESLARMELFLFFTSLLQYFRFTPPPGVSEDDVDLTPVVGFTLNPPIHKLCAVKRSHI
ncbi:cytochrome P450 2K6-like [Garra rufa]|uniref:cytochrome P450 2K6-like n=1 Tax=Garra rufa TaxID=137080 RepID=UPI003CCEB446